MGLREYTLTLTTASDGTGTVSTPNVVGTIERIVIDYAADVAATCDLTFVIDAAVDVPILTVSNTATDGIYHPVRAVNDGADGSALSFYAKLKANRQPIKVTAAQGGDTKVINIAILISDEPEGLLA